MSIVDIASMSCSKIKVYEEKMEEEYFIKGITEDITLFIEMLEKDNRKNVNALGERLKKKIQKHVDEINRVKCMYSFDKTFGNYIYICGVDEVGRGPLAGPIAAGAVILDTNVTNDKDIILGVKDSKKLSTKNREELSEIIKSKAIAYNISLLNNNEIDSRGIAWCNNEVLKRAALGLKYTPDIVLSDGYAVKSLNIQNEFIIKGDAKSASIACASILAKVYRDNLMKEYAAKYPQYGFENNVGYGTQEHIEAIKKYGPCKIHRMSFLKNIYKAY